MQGLHFVLSHGRFYGTLGTIGYYGGFGLGAALDWLKR